MDLSLNEMDPGSKSFEEKWTQVQKKVDPGPKEMDAGSELNGPGVQSNEGQDPINEGQGPNGILEPRVQISRVQIIWTQGAIKMDPGPNKMDPEKMDPGKKWTQVEIKWTPRSIFSERLDKGQIVSYIPVLRSTLCTTEYLLTWWS